MTWNFDSLFNLFLILSRGRHREKFGWYPVPKNILHHKIKIMYDSRSMSMHFIAWNLRKSWSFLAEYHLNNRVRSFWGNAAVVVSVSAHFDVTLVTPSGSPRVFDDPEIFVRVSPVSNSGHWKCSNLIFYKKLRAKIISLATIRSIFWFQVFAFCIFLIY